MPPRIMEDKRTEPELDKAIGTVRNEKLSYWVEHGYEIARREGKPVLVKSGIIEEVSTVRKRLRVVSFGEADRITFEGETRVGFAGLIEAFGIENVERADGIRLRAGRELIVLSARRERRKRVELPAKLRRRLTLRPGARITAQLVAQRVRDDVIPVVELYYPEVYAHFDYVDNRGVLQRRINGKGRKIITMGMKAPINIRGTTEEEEFWDLIYDDLTAEIQDEFGERVRNAQALLGNETNFEVSIYKGFARDGAELKRDAKREGSP